MTVMEICPRTSASPELVLWAGGPHQHPATKGYQQGDQAGLRDQGRLQGFVLRGAHGGLQGQGR